jgi:probable RcsB/C two-component-system connector
MSTNDDDKLANILMGEAIMALLEQGSPVYAEQVKAKLLAMAVSERSASRKQACLRAIDELPGTDPRNAAPESDSTLH